MPKDKLPAGYACAAFACMLAGSTFFPSAADASEVADTAAQQTVEITGSSIKRIDRESALPIQIIKRADIEKTGATSVTELLQRLAVMQGYTEASQSIGGTGGGIATASIHGVGDQRTLVLVDGRRLAAHGLQSLTGANAAIDLNTIPLASVERVEILTDGASSLYGSDAIAGVVNIILRKNFKGGEASAETSRPKGGARESTTNATVGFGDLREDGYNLMLAFGHDTRSKLEATDRNFSRTGTVDFSSGGKPYEFFNGSIYSAPANIQIGDDIFNPHLAATGQCPPVHQAYGNACYYDYASTVEIYPAMKRDTALASFQKTLEGGTVFFADFLYGKSTVTAMIAPPALDIPLPSSSPFFSYATALGATGDTVAYWRGIDIGGRVSEYDNAAFQFAAGLKGSFGAWDYDASYTRSESKAEEIDISGWVTRNGLAQSLDSGSVNPFIDPGSQNAAGLSALRMLQHTGILKAGRTTLDMAELKTSRSLAPLAGGNMQLGAGLDLRRERVNYDPSDIAQGVTDGIAGDDAQEVPFDVSRRSYGAFGELLAPVSNTLELSGSARDDRYSDFGNAATYKLGARWRPSQTVLLRASFGNGFRAPSVPQVKAGRQLYGVTGSSYDCPFPAADPLAAYCLPPQAQYNIYAQGNADLKPERSNQWSFGGRFEPFSSLSIGMDIWDVQIKDAIGQLSESSVMSDPVRYRNNFTLFSDPLTGKNLLALFLPNENLGNIHARGLDFDAVLRSSTSLGRLTNSFAGIYMLKYNFQQESGGTYYSNLGTYRTDPNANAVNLRLIARLSSTLETGHFMHTVNASYKSGYNDQPQSVTELDTGNGVDNFVRRVSSYTTWDWQTAYDYQGWLKLTAGIFNLFNRDPPLSLKSDGGHMLGYDGRYADPRGRSFYVNVRAKFD